MAEINIIAEHVKKELIHEDCRGCGKVTVNSTCSAYPKPAIWWRRGKCPLADHLEIKGTKENKVKVRVGQQKQKKGK